MEPNPLRFSESDLPPEFKHLHGFAQRYGHPEYSGTVQPGATSRDDLLRFWAAVASYRERIAEWHASLGSVDSWPPAAAAFLYMLQALDYAEPESWAQEEHRRRFWESTIYPGAMSAACRIAKEELQKKNYAGVIALLSPYADSLTPLATSTLAYARKKMA